MNVNTEGSQEQVPQKNAPMPIKQTTTQQDHHEDAQKGNVDKQGQPVPIQRQEEPPKAPEEAQKPKETSKDDERRKRKQMLIQDGPEADEVEKAAPNSDTLGHYKLEDNKYYSSRFPPPPPVLDR